MESHEMCMLILFDFFGRSFCLLAKRCPLKPRRRKSRTRRPICLRVVRRARLPRPRSLDYTSDEEIGACNHGITCGMREGKHRYAVTCEIGQQKHRTDVVEDALGNPLFNKLFHLYVLTIHVLTLITRFRPIC